LNIGNELGDDVGLVIGGAHTESAYARYGIPGRAGLLTAADSSPLRAVSACVSGGKDRARVVTKLIATRSGRVLSLPRGSRHERLETLNRTAENSLETAATSLASMSARTLAALPPSPPLRLRQRRSIIEHLP